MITHRSTNSSIAGFLTLFFVASGAVAWAQGIERVSVDSNGIAGNWGSDESMLSADGRYVAFISWATNLVAGDTNGWVDIFVRDRVAGTTERVSVDSSGAQGIPGDFDGSGPSVAISSDGQIVAFASNLVNLVANDTNNRTDVLIHDRASGITERVSVDSSGAEADAGGREPALSGDGRYVCFTSESSLVPGDTNGVGDVFVHDRATGITERISVDSSGIEGNSFSDLAAISADGRFVSFTSFATNLVPNDTNGCEDIFLHDRTTGTTERVDVDSSGTQSNDSSSISAISADGRFVVFDSFADNLVADDHDIWDDVFVRDRIAGTTERVSVDSTGHEGDYDSGCWRFSISGDGRRVAFESGADNLVAGDTNGAWDVFVRDRLAGTTTPISRNALGDLGDADSGGASLSSDGEIVSFYSKASNLISGDTNNQTDVFICVLDVKSRFTHYGAGWPGTLGVPTITPSADPTLGTTISITVGNSLGAATDAVLVVGVQPTLLPSVWGGDLLVDPLVVMWLVLDAGGFTMTGDVPNDPTLEGFVLDLQALELDGGASRGVSFTDGLELVFGD